MLKVYDYKCENGHVHEMFMRPADTQAVYCPTCEQPMTRQLSAPRCALDGVSGHFPGAAMKWERAHEKAGRGTHFQGEGS